MFVAFSYSSGHPVDRSRKETSSVGNDEVFLLREEFCVKIKNKNKLRLKRCRELNVEIV